MTWDTETKECQYAIDLKVTIHHRMPPEGIAEKIQREYMQAHIDSLVGNWMADKKNQQNLMNMILGNTGILI